MGLSALHEEKPGWVPDNVAIPIMLSIQPPIS